MNDQPLKEERWLALYSSYPSLVRLARSLGAREDAEDIASAVLLRIAAKGLDAELVGWSYLARATSNEVIDCHRKLRRDSEICARVRDTPPTSVEDEAIGRVEVGRLSDLALKQQSRETVAMILRRLQGLTWSELAGEFGKTPSAVQSRVRRALLRIRRAIEAETKSA